jgi:molybdopterin-guanine dinucleotide biosynthesis protein A
LTDKKNNITGIILAGGNNYRMGANKAFLEIDGIRLIDKTINIYREIFAEIIIVTNDPLSYIEFADTAIVTDIYKGKGPLGGIYTGLFYSKNNYAFVSACDMPFLNKDFIDYLTGQTDKNDVIVPELADGYQPLHAIYSRNCLPSIKRLLVADKLKITGFYRDMRVLTIPEDQIQPFNVDGRLFHNINTPEDLFKVQGLRFKVQGKSHITLHTSRLIGTGWTHFLFSPS